MSSGSGGLKLALNQISYKPFISLFDVTDASVTDSEISGIGEHLIGCLIIATTLLFGKF